MGLERAAIGNTLGEHFWELDGNLKGTCGEQWKNEKMELCQTFVTIFHLFFGAWVYVVAGWAIWKLAIMHVH